MKTHLLGNRLKCGNPDQRFDTVTLEAGDTYKNSNGIDVDNAKTKLVVLDRPLVAARQLAET
jgi:hypothetical protein